MTPKSLLDSLGPAVPTAEGHYQRAYYQSRRLRIACFYGHPRGDGPFPAVIYNRGGSGDFGALRGPEIVPFVEAGYVAIASQYRGGPGSAGRDEYGGRDVQDVLELAALLRRLPGVDSERIGMVGVSRGGMMTYLALKAGTMAGEQRIQAAVTAGGVADLCLWARERPDMLLYVLVPAMGCWPQQNPEPYRERSATCWPELINTPLLLLHGEADDRVSVEQSRLLARRLAQAGKAVELITYPGEGHTLTGVERGYPAAMAWLQRYLARPGEDLSFETHRARIIAAVDQVSAALGQPPGWLG